MNRRIEDSVLKTLGVNITYLNDADYILNINLSPIEKAIVFRSVYETSRAGVIIGVVIGTICTLALVLTYLFLRQ